MLSPVELRRLVGVLARLGSDFDGERAAAALLASRMLRDRGLSWDTLLSAGNAGAGRTIPPGPPDPSGNVDPGSDLALCQRHVGRLTAWEHEFVRSVARMRRRTPGQSRKLAEIADVLRKNGAK